VRIAFLTYEYPPRTEAGGIGTYVESAASLFLEAGHKVVVFCPAPKEETGLREGIPELYLIHCSSDDQFRRLLPAAIDEYEQQSHIDVIEAPEYQFLHGYIAPSSLRGRLVVRLHTPLRLALILNGYYSRPVLFQSVLRLLLRGNIRAAIRKLRSYRPLSDAEYRSALQADLLLSPSKSLLGKLSKIGWKPIAQKAKILPNPLILDNRLLSLRPPQALDDGWITFLGRIEKRKGVFTLSQAIKMFALCNPGYSFRFIGADLVDHDGNSNTKQLLFLLSGIPARIEFTGKVGHSELVKCLADASVCILPSIWENFPYACMEAMSAARPVIASQAGGMSEMIEANVSGLLVNPNRPSQICSYLTHLSNNRSLLAYLGDNARSRIVNRYSTAALREQYVRLYSSLAS
jgi:glycogen(starch) synthase